MHTVPEDRCIWVLEDRDFYSFSEKPTKESAHAYLVKMTGVDLGYDTVAWRKWFRENLPEIVAWFDMVEEEIYICIIEECNSATIIGFMTTKDEARANLTEFTGVDLGYDGKAWRKWFWENRPEIARYFVYG